MCEYIYHELRIRGVAKPYFGGVNGATGSGGNSSALAFPLTGRTGGTCGNSPMGSDGSFPGASFFIIMGGIIGGIIGGIGPGPASPF